MTSAIAYLRCSTLGQDLSPQAQRDSIATYCARSGLTVTAWHEDIGVSGAAPIDKCPGLEAALAALRPGMVLIVAKMDRLARDVFKHALVERLVAAQKARLLSADGTGNEEGPEGALLRAIVSAFAAYERALIRMRTRQALKVIRARGRRFSRHAPFGYRHVDGQLVPVPAELAARDRFGALLASGMTARSAMRALRAEGLPVTNCRGIARALKYA